MPVVIELTGEFGWEIRPTTVSKKLSRVNDQDVIVRLSSMGGDVFDGADVVNLFVDFRRDNPSIKMTLEIKAIAASYGSALMAAPIWDDIGISQVSAVMIHRASTFAYINAVEAQGLIDFLSGLDNVYSQMYAERTGESQDSMLSAMTEETWYFGQEIIDMGFADRIITIDDEGGDQLPLLDEEEDRNIFLVDFKNKREALMDKMREERRPFDMKRAVACLREKPEMIKPVPEEPKSETDQNIPGEPGKTKQEVTSMTLDELKKENPDVYKSAMKMGADKFKAGNDERVKALSEMKASDDYKDIPEVVSVIDEAIMNGDSVEATNTKMMAAMMKVMKDPARMAAIESPADIAGGDSVEETATESRLEA